MSNHNSSNHNQAFDLILLGASGNLALTKILPSLYLRFVKNEITSESRIIGTGTRELLQQDFHDLVIKYLREYLPKKKLNDKQILQFCSILSYHQVDFYQSNLHETKALLRQDKLRIFYLSIPAEHFYISLEKIHESDLINKQSRLIVEKPLGNDLHSMQEINDKITQYFSEDQIYRIDHYLGKESVQNLMILRFANAYFEPLWNSSYIEYVQISVAENIGIKGREKFYDKVGALRDMVQNHLMQLLSLIAMEAPVSLESDDIHDEKVKVINSLRAPKLGETVRAIYDGDENRNSYLQDVNNPNSETETYTALVTYIDNWRWHGVPFYLRTGKNLSKRTSEIIITFKNKAHILFPDRVNIYNNKLIIRLQPNESVQLITTVKDPYKSKLSLKDFPIDMFFDEMKEGNDADVLSAYEKLFMEVVMGNQTLFMRYDEIKASWKWIDTIINQWQNSADGLARYGIGSDGPKEADLLLLKNGHTWDDL